MIIHVAVIEWESSESPSVFLGNSWRSVAERAAATVQLVDEVSDEPEYFHDVAHPERLRPPGQMVDEDLRQWHDDLREATTIPWVTFYEEEVA